MAPLKIGMPVYNGARFVAAALQSLVDQSFGNWELLIADNASSDDTEAICRDFVARDARVKYVRHAENIGAAPNFKHVLDWADSRYFMWTSYDDVWGKEFINNCISRLMRDERLGMAFTGLEVIDTFGQTIRECHDIPRFSGGANFSTIARYVWSPEFHGKANLIHSIFRTEVCKTAWARCPIENGWGGDMCFNLAAISIAGIDVVPETHFFKRDPRHTDQLGMPAKIVVPESLVDRSCPVSMFAEYSAGTLKAVRGTRFYPLVRALMWARYQQLKKLS